MDVLHLEAWAAPVLLAAAQDGKPPALDHIAGYVFLDIAVIIIAARIMGKLAVRLRQPAVVGEITAGIMLGPSLLGALPGDLTQVLFPSYVRPYLSILAQVGLIIFMFIVGLELDLNLVKGKERAAATISLASVVLPFSLGIGLAFLLHQSHGVVRGEDVGLLPFALFIGASMSVTAFPVLARILTDRGMHRTQTGVLTLACAAVDDVLAWSILAVVLAVVSAGSLLGLPLILLESVAFVLVMFFVVKPRLRALVRAYKSAGRLTPDILAIVIVGFLVSAWTTEQIGIHAIFGAFVFGVIMPREDSHELFASILDKLEQVSVLLLLPVFFIATGLNVNIRGLGLDSALELLAVLAVAISGKFLGASVAARAVGIRARRAAAVGILMNTRGLTELVILNVGLQAGVLDLQLFTILVIMALVTTVMTEPLLRLVYPDKLLARDVAEAERAALGLLDAYRVIAVVDDDPRTTALVDSGVGMLGGEDSAELVLSRLDPPVKRVEVGSGLVGELAAITATFGHMQVLVQRAAALGARAVPSSRFSDDPARDLLAQAEAVQPHLLLLPVDPADDARTYDADALLRTVDCAVGLQVLGAAVPAPVAADGGLQIANVLLDAGQGDDALAAFEQAIRLALMSRAPLTVLDDSDRASRRLSGMVTRLRSLGLPVSMVPRASVAPSRGDVMVAGLGLAKGRSLRDAVAVHSRHDAATLLVRAAVDDHGECLHELLQRLEEQRGSTRPTTDPPARQMASAAQTDAHPADSAGALPIQQYVPADASLHTSSRKDARR